MSRGLARLPVPTGQSSPGPVLSSSTVNMYAGSGVRAGSVMLWTKAWLSPELGNGVGCELLLLAPEKLVGKVLLSHTAEANAVMPWIWMRRVFSVSCEWKISCGS